MRKAVGVIHFYVRLHFFDVCTWKGIVSQRDYRGLSVTVREMSPHSKPTFSRSVLIEEPHIRWRLLKREGRGGCGVWSGGWLDDARKVSVEGT
jgi:hypothetical protein